MTKQFRVLGWGVGLVLLECSFFNTWDCQREARINMLVFLFYHLVFFLIVTVSTYLLFIGIFAFYFFQLMCWNMTVAHRGHWMMACRASQPSVRTRWQSYYNQLLKSRIWFWNIELCTVKEKNIFMKLISKMRKLNSKQNFLILSKKVRIP